MAAERVVPMPRSSAISRPLPQIAWLAARTARRSSRAATSGSAPMWARRSSRHSTSRRHGGRDLAALHAAHAVAHREQDTVRADRRRDAGAKTIPVEIASQHHVLVVLAHAADVGGDRGLDDQRCAVGGGGHARSSKRNS
jgi:hypothetical protein